MLRNCDCLQRLQNDMLQWLIDEAVRQNHSDISVIERIMLINFAAIHTSSTVRVSFLLSSETGNDM